jgi:hypothetical protein
MSPLSHNLTTANYNNNLINSLENRLLEGYTKTYNEKKDITTPSNQLIIQQPIPQHPPQQPQPQHQQPQLPLKFKSVEELKNYWKKTFKRQNLAHLCISLSGLDPSLTDEFLSTITGKNRGKITNDIVNRRYEYLTGSVEEPEEPDEPNEHEEIEQIEDFYIPQKPRRSSRIESYFNPIPKKNTTMDDLIEKEEKLLSNQKATDSNTDELNDLLSPITEDEDPEFITTAPNDAIDEEVLKKIETPVKKSRKKSQPKEKS